MTKEEQIDFIKQQYSIDSKIFLTGQFISIRKYYTKSEAEILVWSFDRKWYPSKNVFNIGLFNVNLANIEFYDIWELKDETKSLIPQKLITLSHADFVNLFKMQEIYLYLRKIDKVIEADDWESICYKWICLWWREVCAP